MTGGGSGGHITPILAVAYELKRQAPDCAVTYIGHKGDDLLDVVKESGDIAAIETVSAGKLRRYSGEGWRQLLDVRTQLLNVRDVFRTVWGIFESYRVLGRIRPDVVFTRGGFVSVPVSFAARLRRVPYITHDSDTIPSLANRLIARGAVLHIVAMPVELYPYPLEKTVMSGIPAGHNYKPVSAEQAKKYRHELGLAEYDQVILLTGGGNGARALNRALVDNARYLLAAHPDLVLLHFAGRALEQETNDAYDGLGLGKARSRVRVYGFAADFYRYSGAADIVVARGGMSTLAEFALQRRACVIVPSKQLAWNVKNSQVLASRGAVIELPEEHAEQPERLGRLLSELLHDADRRQELGEKLGSIARPDAAKDIADRVLAVGAQRTG